MDVHPTKNVSIGIDPYPYSMALFTFVAGDILHAGLSDFGKTQIYQWELVWLRAKTRGTLLFTPKISWSCKWMFIRPNLWKIIGFNSVLISYPCQRFIDDIMLILEFDIPFN
jgi:hypothetical protein